MGPAWGARFLYLTGGLAFGEVSAFDNLFAVSGSEWRVGWMFGGGAEVMFTPQLSLKVAACGPRNRATSEHQTWNCRPIAHLLADKLLGGATERAADSGALGNGTRGRVHPNYQGLVRVSSAWPPIQICPTLRYLERLAETCASPARH